MKTTSFLRIVPFTAAALGLSLASANAKAPSGRYVIAGQNQQQTVYDTKTRLTWERGFATPLTADAAKERCATLGATLGGSGWRVPTVKELYTIVDLSPMLGRGGDVLIDVQAFGDTPAGTFWTTTPPQSLALFQCVNFGTARNGCNPETNLLRCVR